MTQPNVPHGGEWADVVAALHALTNLVTARSHYAEGHPAIARADEVAAALFTPLLARLPELVIALIDGEFVVCERPMPDLRERVTVLADAMTRHQIECIVFQRGLTLAECTLVGRTLAARAEPGRAHEQARATLTHVGFRYAEVRARDNLSRGGKEAKDLVPIVHGVLGDAARAIAARALVDREAVRSAAETIVASCEARTFLLVQRSYSEGSGDDATHAANVASMTAAMALDEGLDGRTCVEITAAALLHDIGHLFMPANVRGVPEPLLDVDGRGLFRHHPYVGASALLAAGCPSLWVAVALEHHRGVDGKGYPELEGGRAPHDLVRLVALANYVDRRRTLLRGVVDAPDEALRRAASMQDRYFAPRELHRFVRALGAYPPGTTVELSDRRSGIVVAANPGDPVRPIVRILGGPDDNQRLDLKQLDAVEDRHLLSIVRAIPPPILVRPAGPPPVEEAPERAPAPRAPAMPSLRPTARVSGLYSSVPRARSESSAPPVAVTMSVPPPLKPSVAPDAESPEQLERSCLDTLGPLARIPRVAVSGAELGKLSLDHRAGFVLTFVDGMSSLDDILDASGLPRLEALRLLRDLVRAGVVTLG
ncbi:MAG TPA: HD domain-containing protein [Polyangiaceae bacterium]